MNSLNTSTEFSLEELKKESVMGVMGTETQREGRIIDLSDFENRKYDICRAPAGALQISTSVILKIANMKLPINSGMQRLRLVFFKLPITAFRKKRFSTHLVWQNNFLLCHAKLKHNIP